MEEPSAARASVTRASVSLVPGAPESAAAHPLSAPPATPSPVMGLLQQGLPLTLLLDLAWGVRSQEVYEAEPADLSWLRPVVA